MTPRQLAVSLSVSVTSCALMIACSGSPASVLGPTSASAAAGQGSAADDSHALVLTAVTGTGSGIVNVTANARTGDFVTNTQDSVSVHGVAPNRVLYVRVAADAGLPGGQQSDGSCQRASLNQFAPIASSPGGAPATFETSAGGTGNTHIVLGATSPVLPEGARLDLMFRVVDALPPAVPTIDLRTRCFTVMVR